MARKQQAPARQRHRPAHGRRPTRSRKRDAIKDRRHVYGLTRLLLLVRDGPRSRKRDLHQCDPARTCCDSRREPLQESQIRRPADRHQGLRCAPDRQVPLHTAARGEPAPHPRALRERDVLLQPTRYARFAGERQAVDVVRSQTGRCGRVRAEQQRILPCASSGKLATSIPLFPSP